MIKKLGALVLALTIMLVPMSAFAVTDHITFQDEQISVDIPHGFYYRDKIVSDYTGIQNEDLRMKRVFLLYDKSEVYMNLEYIAQEGGKTYDMSTEKKALKMFEESGDAIMRETLVSSSMATSADVSDPEYFEASDGTGYIKVELMADGATDVNMIVYISCTQNTVYRMFTVFGELDKEKEQYKAIDPENIEVAETIIGTFKDTGFDKKYLANETESKGSALKGALKFAGIGLVLGMILLVVFILGGKSKAKKTGQAAEIKLTKNGKTLSRKNFKEKGKIKEEDVVVRSVRDSYADRGKNPNAKKGKNHNADKKDK